MKTEETVSQWMDQLQGGDPRAVQKLWERYYQSLVKLARNKLRGRHVRASDEEDVALSAFDSFCRGAEEGRFPQLQDWANLWSLLVLITVRKAHHVAAHERRQKRGGNAVLDEAAYVPGLAQVLDKEPTPELAAQMTEEYQQMLAGLPDAELQSVAQWKMDGFTNEEIAVKLNCALRSVERKVRVIRSFLWAQSDSEAPSSARHEPCCCEN